MEQPNKFLPASQDADEVEAVCPMCLLRECLCDEPEQDQEEFSDIICEGSNARKRPMSYVDEDDAAQEMIAMHCSEAWTDVLSDEPDLYKYFNYFGLTEQDMVRTARAFATFVDKRVQYRKKKEKESATAATKAGETHRFARPAATGSTKAGTATRAISKHRRIDIDLVNDD